MQSTYKKGAAANTEQKDVLPDELRVDNKKQKRTVGLKVMDGFIYPFMNNFAVFGISLFATYLTSYGDRYTGDGFAAKSARWLKGRGDKFMNFAQNTLKMNHDSADMAKTVFFSFLDGSIMAPFIKFFEDRREVLAKRIDNLLGTKPKDESVYEAEPKQTWKSVLLGRAFTAAIVVPTAIILDKQKFKVDGHDEPQSLNNILFRNPGKKWGQKFEESDKKIAVKAREKFPSIDWEGMFKISAFEAFYTSVCTAAQYAFSRIIARRDDKKHDAKQKVETQTSTQPIAENTAPVDERSLEENSVNKGEAEKKEKTIEEAPVEYVKRVRTETGETPTVKLY